jgi:hypothetical protein
VNLAIKPMRRLEPWSERLVESRTSGAQSFSAKSFARMSCTLPVSSVPGWRVLNGLAVYIPAFEGYHRMLSLPVAEAV